MNSPRGHVAGELDTLTVEHTAVVYANKWVVGTDCELIRVYGINGKTLRLGLDTHVGVQVDENIVWVVALYHLRTPQVKLPATVATHGG